MPLTLPLIVPAIRLDKDADAEIAKALERATQPWVAGFILFGGNVEQVAELTTTLRATADRRILIASDMERGAGQQVAGLTRLPDLGLLGLAGTERDAFAAGRITGAEAVHVGIDVVFGPCLDVRSEIDNPILGNRSFGFSPWRVAAMGASYVDGIGSAGAMAVTKHFPGHGATREDSHETAPVVHADLATLEGRDLLPFERVGTDAIMAAHVAFPALDPSGTVATCSAPILDRARRLGASPEEPDDGDESILIFTDAMIMSGALGVGTEAEACARALAAGCDILLYPEDCEAVAAHLEDDADAERAAANLAYFYAMGHRTWDARDAMPLDEPLRRMDALAERALDLGGPVHPEPDLLVLIDDDGMEDRGDVLAAAAAATNTPVLRICVPQNADAPLPELHAQHEGHPHTAFVVFASARAWKGASGVSEAGLACVKRLRMALDAQDAFAEVIWCAPTPGSMFDRHLPGTGPQVERALARALFPDLDGAP